jgi:hypothetical protein
MIKHAKNIQNNPFFYESVFGEKDGRKIHIVISDVIITTV